MTEQLQSYLFVSVFRQLFSSVECVKVAGISSLDFSVCVMSKNYLVIMDVLNT